MENKSTFWASIYIIICAVIYFSIFGLSFVSLIFSIVGTFLVAFVIGVIFLMFLSIWDSIKN